MGRRKTSAAERAEQAREAEEYLRRYLAEAAPRLRWLREEAARSGGPAPDRLDHSRDSLVPLWTWAMDRFEERSPDQPLDRVEEGLGRYFVPRGATLPIWYGRRAVQAPHFWSDDTLALLDALVYYLAECLLRANPEARWAVFHSDWRNHIDENQPVLTGFGEPVDLLLPAMNLAGRVHRRLHPEQARATGLPVAAPPDLRDWFDEITARATPTGAPPQE
ncbi:hypothetical protein [Micromonospora chersina]|uniref:Uncharacterized protein n=1 Tax=Micromonospora chersina TaxID=47854 RepID=A0A1C6V0Z7_9ACTN|nr:hypothetical protein [Micromonospora chersina]SCL59972.1 hypothetical protein GA0070603_2926 [Micromonospora chersina]